MDLEVQAYKVFVEVREPDGSLTMMEDIYAYRRRAMLEISEFLRRRDVKELIITYEELTKQIFSEFGFSYFEHKGGEDVNSN